MEEKSAYRSILKSTSLFGGVQIYQILIAVIKSKVVAIFLGPLGIGIQGLLTSATSLVQSLTSFGLSQSAVRDVSESYAKDDLYSISKTVTVLRKLVRITGVLGTLTVAITSPFLSKVTFGNNDYTLSFIFLSITLLFDQLCVGQKVLLQGTRRLKDLAKATALGSTFGLIVSVPIYYLFGIKGIVPTLILNSITSLSLSWWFSRKIHIIEIKLTRKELISNSKQMVSLGLAMSISAILAYLISFAIRSFIGHHGGAEMVGLYTAGYTIIITYVGMVFTALGTDYYPKLSGLCHDDIKCFELVNRQGEIACLILTPLLVGCLVFMPFVIRILYSESFMASIDYIAWAIPGILFKLLGWLLAFIIIAKGNSKRYLFIETIAKSYTILLDLLLYSLWGLKGLGISSTASFVIYYFQVIYSTKNNYGFSFDRIFIALFIRSFFIVMLAFIMYLSLSGLYLYIVGGALLLLSGLISIKGLLHRVR